MKLVYILSVAATLFAFPSLSQREAIPVRGVNVHQAAGPEMNAVSRMNLNWVRVDIPWADIEAVQGQFEWRDSWVDGSIDAAVTRGLKIYASLGTAPPWACRPGSQTQRMCVPRNRLEWERFVREVAGRYKGLISVYGIWNEPNLGQSWQGDAVEYVSMLLEPAVKIIKEVDPAARIASPDLSSSNSPRIKPQAFMDAITNAGLSGSIDVVSWHVYEETGRVFCSSFKGASGIYRRFFNGNNCEHSQLYWIDRSGLRGKPIFITETGFENGGDAGRSVLDVFEVFRGEQRIEGVFFFELRDNSGMRTGLLKEDGSWKPGADLLSDSLPSGGRSQPPLMFEDFELKPWFPTLHRWYLSSSDYTINQGAFEVLQKDFVATVSDTVVADFEISTTVQIADDLDSPHNWTGLIARAQEINHGFRQSGYVVFLRATGAVGIFRAPDTLLGYVKSGIDPKEAPFILTFRGEGPLLTVSVNGRQILSVTDSEFSKGYVGMHDYSVARHFDFVLREIR